MHFLASCELSLLGGHPVGLGVLGGEGEGHDGSLAEEGLLDGHVHVPRPHLVADGLRGPPNHVLGTRLEGASMRKGLWGGSK